MISNYELLDNWDTITQFIDIFIYNLQLRTSFYINLLVVLVTTMFMSPI